jgi:hypothetical protein
MKVTLMPGIAEISGSTKPKHGKRMVFMTRTNSKGKRETRMYLRNADDYQRTTPPSEAELAARSLFARRQAYVQHLLASGKCHTKADAWKIAKDHIKS